MCTHLASRARANTPAASGAAADVPECVVVHLPYRSVVACNETGVVKPMQGRMAKARKVKLTLEMMLKSHKNNTLKKAKTFFFKSPISQEHYFAVWWKKGSCLH